METQSKLVAIVGGSGAGKSWLVGRLQRALGPIASRIALDDFYLDHSRLPRAAHDRLNLDHPRAIDWPALEQTLLACRTGQTVRAPQYSFATHTRLPEPRAFVPTPIVLVDGLWLMSRRNVRELFDFRVFLDCPAQLRLDRRLARDVVERGRNADAVRQQFWKSVAPMHDRHVAPQACWADILLRQPPSEQEVLNLAETIRTLVESPALFPEVEAPASFANRL